MKKLLFSLVAAAACGAVTADNVPATATFESLTAEATFDVGKTEDQTVEIDVNNLGYWAVNEATDPELTVKAKSESDKYLSIATGSTPLWRTFTGIGVVASAKAGTLPAGVAADGKVVSSDVKLTACTEFPKLTDFPDEKLALFLFAPEEGDTTPEGLYAIGGEMTDEGLKAKAYKLDIDVTGLNVTNAQGWAKVSIKTYGDIYKGDNSTTYPAFVIGINGSVVGVAGDYVTGFENDAKLIPAATTRITGKTLIPAALTGDGTIAGLGFQGEGGIDNVNLFANDFATDATTMTATISSDVTPTFTGATYANGALTFTDGTPITFTVASSLDIVTVKYNNNDLVPVGGVYTITTPATTDTLVISAAPAAFQIGDAKYATLTEALAGLTSGSTLKLLGNVTLDATMPVLAFTEGNITIDLNGKTISGADEYVIVNQGATIEIVGAGIVGAGSVGSVLNAAGVLTLTGGAYEGLVVNGEGATLNLTKTAKFKVKEGLTVPGGLDWSAADSDGYYTLVDAGPVTSTTVDLSEAGTGADVEVTPTIAESVTEVTVENVPQGFAGKVVIPSTVEKIIGVAKDQLKVMVSVTGDDSVTKTYNITEAIKLAADGTISLDDTKTVTVEVTVGDKTVSEDISVKPELATTAADGATEVAPFEAGATPAATVKTIPGLTYSLDYDSDVKGAFGTSAASKTADGNRMTLQDTSDKTGVTKRFYKIRVRK